MGRASILLGLALGAGGCEAESTEQTTSTGAPQPQTQIEKDCQAMCDQGIALGCEDSSCAPNCVFDVETAGACKEPTAAYVACLADGFESCTTLPERCRPARNALVACHTMDGGCSTVECVDPGVNTCRCGVACGTSFYEESCAPGTDGAYDCTCTVDGMVTQTCPGMPTACAFFVGCCMTELPQ